MDILTIKLQKRIDTKNVDEVDKQITETLNATPHEGVIFDLEDLEYISSAGLRMFLKVAKKEKSFQAINASKDVYDIFEVTGFTKIFPVRKALKELSIDDSEMIGLGYQSAVYRVDPETIVKVFSPQTTLEDVEREKEMAKKALIMGLPTSLSFDIVKVRNQYGALYEMIEALPVSRLIIENPDQLEQYSQDYANLLKQLHELKGQESEGFTSHKQRLLDYANDQRYEGLFTADELEKITKAIETIPESDTLLHGDFHFDNVLEHGDELTIIDMGDMGYGHPIFDLLPIYDYMFIASKATGNIEALGKDELEKIWDVFIRTYFDTDDEAKVERIKKAVEAYTKLRNLVTVPFNRKFSEANTKRFIERNKPAVMEVVDQMPGMVDF